MGGSGDVLRRFSDGLAELYATAGAPGSDMEYAARVVSVVSRLVAADSCSYNYIGAAPSGPAMLAWFVEPADVGTFPGGAELLNQHLPEHPVLAHYQVTGDGRTRRISDFLSGRQFHSLGLYHDFYRLVGTEYQASFGIPTPDGGLIGVALNRQRHDFSTRDLEFLDLLRIHVGQAGAIALTQPGPATWPGSADHPLLTPRQSRILQLVADGQSDRGIARILGISPRTVHAHLQHTYRALDVTSRTEAVARCRALGAAPGLSLSGPRARS
jgi:DNA-binding CsgD family transcriptional regulator